MYKRYPLRTAGFACLIFLCCASLSAKTEMKIYGVRARAADKETLAKKSLPGKNDLPALDADLISAEIRKDASAVIRYSKKAVELSLRAGVSEKEEVAVTVLTEEGQKAASVFAFYSKTEPLRNLKAALYDAHGKLIRKIKSDEFQDLNYDDQVSMFNDERFKKFEPAMLEFPFTIVYEEENIASNTFAIPSFRPQSELGVAIETSSFQVTVKSDIKINVNQENIAEPRVSTTPNGDKIYKWEIQNKQAFRRELFSPRIETYVPHVFISTDHVKIESYSGSFSSWKDYGLFMYTNFLKNAEELPLTTKQEVGQLVAAINDPKEKARAIYEYMQHKMRYVGVQVGIGGFKTETAYKVDAQGYSDCKGLCNYTRALLKAAGIEAYYCEVRSGSRNILETIPADFAAPGLSGDHIILCLPFKTDTTWLECTSKDLPFGYIGDFTDNREAVMITPEGGKIVHTAVYDEKQNLQVRNALIQLSADGNASGSLETKFSGADYDDREYLNDLSFSKAVEYLKTQYRINRLEIGSYQIDHQKTGEPVTVEKIKFTVPQMLETRDKGYIVNACPFSQASVLAFTRHKRTMPVVVGRGFREIDTITYVLPPGYKAPLLTPLEEVHTQFGDFSLHFLYEKDKVKCIRYYTSHAGKWSPDVYDDFVKFHQKIVALDDYAVRIEPGG